MDKKTRKDSAGREKKTRKEGSKKKARGAKIRLSPYLDGHVVPQNFTSILLKLFLRNSDRGLAGTKKI
jgi:hypothetical protein